MDAEEATEKPPSVHESAEPAGADEADVVALYVVASGADLKDAAALLTTFEVGHHAALLRMPTRMVGAVARVRATPDTLGRVNKVAAELRGKAKPTDWVQLSLHDLEAIVRVCGRAKGRPVFLYSSE
jgi:hypothetical protein